MEDRTVYGVVLVHIHKMLPMVPILMPLVRLLEHFIRGVDMPILGIRKFTSMARHHTIGHVHRMVVMFMISNYGKVKVYLQIAEISHLYSMFAARRSSKRFTAISIIIRTSRVGYGHRIPFLYCRLRGNCPVCWLSDRNPFHLLLLRMCIYHR